MRGPTFLGRKPGPHRTRKREPSIKEQVDQLLSEWHPTNRCDGCYGDPACTDLTHDACRAGARAAKRRERR